jgi:hypothetical protein
MAYKGIVCVKTNWVIQILAPRILVLLTNTFITIVEIGFQ